MKFVKRTDETIHLETLFQGIMNGNSAQLSKAITLIESNASRHFTEAQKLIQKILPYTKQSIRIGISGVPGAGKSTFIEALGLTLCNQGHRVAVLAIDPSSSLSGGSILGDKTRMEQLSSHPLAFIRPSPSEGVLGGVHRKTRESMLLCEAAGFNVIIVETVGVGQSEAVVRAMTDIFLMLVITGAGDELQGMKKGILELVDAIIVNKADGDNKIQAELTKDEYNRILHFLQPATKGWQTEAYTCSSILNEGIEEIWKMINLFIKSAQETGVFEERRQEQLKEWMKQSLTNQLLHLFFTDELMKKHLPLLEKEILTGEKTVSTAVMEAIELFKSSQRK